MANAGKCDTVPRISEFSFLFDIGNVIIRFDYRVAMERVADRCEVPVQEIIPRLRPLNERFELGELDTDTYIAQASDEIGYRGPSEFLITSFADIFELNEPVAELIRQLSGSGRHSLFLLSNTNAIHVPFFTRKWVDIFSLFDRAVYSHEAGFMKPDPRIFDHAIEFLDLEPERTIYIDDLPENCEAGTAKGLRSICYDHESHGDLLDQIEAILGEEA